MPLYKQDCNNITKHSSRTPLNVICIPIFSSWGAFFPSRKYKVKEQNLSVGSPESLNMKAAGESSPCPQPHGPGLERKGLDGPGLGPFPLWAGCLPQFSSCPFQSGFLSFLTNFNTLKQALKKKLGGLCRHFPQRNVCAEAQWFENWLKKSKIDWLKSIPLPEWTTWNVALLIRAHPS